MFLYILRHGEAEPKGAKPDEERSLSPTGKAQIRKVMDLAARLGFSPDKILSSPYERARQTAEIASKVLKKKKIELVVEDSLEPNRTPYEVYETLSRFKDSNELLLVSHQPLIGELIADLLGCEARVAMKPGSIAGIDCEFPPTHAAGTLVLLLSADLL